MLALCEIGSLRQQRCTYAAKSPSRHTTSGPTKSPLVRLDGPRQANQAKENIIATIIERPRKNKASNWQAIIRIGGKSKARTFEHEQDARAFAQVYEAKMKKDDAKHMKAQTKARASDPTLFDFNNETLRDALINFCTSEDALRTHRITLPTLLKHIDGVKIGELNTKWVKDYIARLRKAKSMSRKEFAYATISVHLRVMSRACRWTAEQWNLPNPDLPFNTKSFPKNWQTSRSRRLSSNEEHRLRKVLRNIRAASSPHWRCLMQLALETGARLQELVLADWTEMEISRRLWTLPANHTKSVKTRAIPLSKRAIRYLKFLRADASSQSTRVFHRLGTPIVVSAGFHKHTRIAGLVDFRFHDLRHEAISRMVLYKRKLSVFEIMVIVGHSEMAMLLRYANLRGDELADRME